MSLKAKWGKGQKNRPLTSLCSEMFIKAVYKHQKHLCQYFSYVDKSGYHLQNKEGVVKSNDTRKLEIKIFGKNGLYLL